MVSHLGNGVCYVCASSVIETEYERGNKEGVLLNDTESCSLLVLMLPTLSPVNPALPLRPETAIGCCCWREWRSDLTPELREHAPLESGRGVAAPGGAAANGMLEPASDSDND
jgi:hypothetical protein